MPQLQMRVDVICYGRNVWPLWPLWPLWLRDVIIGGYPEGRVALTGERTAPRSRARPGMRRATGGGQRCSRKELLGHRFLTRCSHMKCAAGMAACTHHGRARNGGSVEHERALLDRASIKMEPTQTDDNSGRVGALELPRSNSGPYAHSHTLTNILAAHRHRH